MNLPPSHSVLCFHKRFWPVDSEFVDVGLPASHALSTVSKQGSSRELAPVAQRRLAQWKVGLQFLGTQTWHGRLEIVPASNPRVRDSMQQQPFWFLSPCKPKQHPTGTTRLFPRCRSTSRLCISPNWVLAFYSLISFRFWSMWVGALTGAGIELVSS